MKSEKKSGAERTQLAVRDEWWSDERIRSFLELETTAEEALDFHILNKAYQGMVPEAFERFIQFFVEADRNINQTNIYGNSILTIIAEHKNSEEYAEILKKAGAV
ncbi:PA4642 family protein [Gammaproteobacteria bacterium]|nr:PA4642 family protein [Gammaproteobacteria bacterium]